MVMSLQVYGSCSREFILDLLDRPQMLPQVFLPERQRKIWNRWNKKGIHREQEAKRRQNRETFENVGLEN
jgi:hypothetical protein